MADIKEQTGTLTTKDGLDLFYRKVLVENPRAGVVFAHGLGEHSGRYGHLAERLFSMSVSFWAVDHRGHGKSGGPRGHVLQFDQYLQDLEMIVDMARKELDEGKKLFLVGHSMGGLIALRFAIQHGNRIDGVVASSPALGMVVDVPVWKETLGKVMSNAWPGLTMNNELQLDKISKDEEVVRDYKNDPLVHTKVSARWFTEFVSSMERANTLVGTIRMPVLMQVAGDDYLVHAPSSKNFFEKLAAEDKTLHYYDGYYHEVYHAPEPDRVRVLDDFAAWLERQVG